jgi:hypothetical protein
MENVFTNVIKINNFQRKIPSFKEIPNTLFKCAKV